MSGHSSKFLWGAVHVGATDYVRTGVRHQGSDLAGRRNFAVWSELG
jgi:hypothetical protein